MNPSPNDVCPKCNGTGTERTDKGGRTCECRLRLNSDLLLARAKIPDRYKDSTLTNYICEPGNVTQQAAVHYSLHLIEDYPLSERGLMLIGPTGVGKTHLAVAILKGLITKGVPSLFCETTSLLKHIQRSYSPLSQLSEMEILHPVFKAEVLLLDELGALTPSEWVLGTLLDLVNARYNDMKLTIFTSNYGDQAVGRAGQTLADRIGVRVRSRIHEMCKTHVIEANDFRQRRGTEQRRPLYPGIATTPSEPLPTASPFDQSGVDSLNADPDISH